MGSGDHWITWIGPVWFLAGALIGGVWLVRDELYLRRTKPTLEAIRAYADHLEAKHGREAYLMTGEAMCAASEAHDFDHYRFLKEVSGELAARLARR